MTHPRVCLTCRYHDKVADCEHPTIHASMLSADRFGPVAPYFNPPIDFHCSLYELDSGNPELDSISAYANRRLEAAS